MIRSEQASAALYTVVLLPFLTGLSLVAIDVSGFHALRDDLQRRADRIAFSAAQQLPNTSAAQDEIDRAFARALKDGASGRLISSDHGAIVLELAVDHQPVFGKLIPGGVRLDVAVHSQAVVVPSDYVLIFPDGETLRPRDGIPWGDALSWPASRYFSSCALPPPPDLAPTLAGLWEDEEFRRLATQSCFNPVLNDLKAAALKLVAQVTALGTNRLSVVYTPGDIVGAGSTLARAFNDNGQYSGTARWAPYRELDSGLGDESCVLFSVYDPIYARTAEDPIAFPPCGIPHVPFRDGVLSPTYFQQLSVEDAVYWRASRRGEAPGEAVPNLPAALGDAVVQLLATPPTREHRGNLGETSAKRIIALMDSLPEPSDSAFEKRLIEINRARIQLLVIAFEHDGLTRDERMTLRQRASALQADRRLRLVFADSPVALRGAVTSEALRFHRQIALRR